MSLVSILTSAAGGGLFGVVGQVANRGIGIFEAKEKRKDTQLSYQQEEKRWAHETGLLELQMRAKSEETESELRVAETSGAWASFASSQSAEAAIGKSYPWVDAVRALVRPVLTLESQVALIVLVILASQAERATILAQVTDTVTFIATAAALWWFGERAQRPSKGK